ncbi:AP2 isoform A [Chlorella sorokiniana]|uniref:AP2 isoform A n=1 Tax=Chlorella sorokiniana TaxID=3076 RepID=A0A2P6TCQ5_CHLSO|nr:AP2 isoform A [Chlorella sorokiniana]|eukprot:PRW20434.1 AP2 isoform A [Chlorella sorokiniana]
MNGQSHATPEDAAHAYDCMLYFLEDDPDYNLPARMTADVKNALAQHRDVFEYLEAQKKLSAAKAAAKADANFRKGTSKYRGVNFDKSSSMWRSSVGVNGKLVQKKFGTEEEAAHDYDRKAIRKDGRKALLNFPLAAYAAEFSEAELDAIDARVAAGKPPPAMGTAAAAKKRGKGKAPAAAAKPRQQRSGGAAAAATAAAAAAAGEASGSGGSGDATEQLPEYEDWEEEWEEEAAATCQDDPATWTREQRQAYRLMHPFEDIFTPAELEELEEDVQRLNIRDDFEDFKREKREEVRRDCEARVARWAALLEEVRDTEDEPYVAADLAQSQRELDSWEEQVPSNQRLWAMFEAEEMERYNEFLHQRIIKYPLTFGALSEDHWFNPLTGQPNIAAMQGALGVLESDLPQVMKAMQDDDEKDAYVVKLLRIRNFLDAKGIEQPGLSAEELVQLRWALGRDEDVDEEDPEEGYGVFDASDEEEEEEPPPIAAFPPDFFRGTVEALLGGVVDAAHGIFERAENGPAAAAGLPPNTPPNPRYAPSPAGAVGGGSQPADAGGSGGGAGSHAGASAGAGASSSGKPPAPSGWLNIENFGEQAAADPQVRADWQYEMTLATPSGSGGQFTTEQYAQMLANILRRERQRQEEGHLPGWNGAPDIRTEEEQEAAAEAQEAAWSQEKAAMDARMAELERDGARLVRHVKNYTWDVGERVRVNRFQMMMTYWEGQCLAHLRAGHYQWLEDLLGPEWRERIKEVGVSTPHLFGTHNWRASLPPIDPTVDIIFMEMTGWVANTPLSEGLASMMGWTNWPTLDDPTLALWYHTICEQAQLGLPTIGLSPVEHWSPTCTKWDWRQEMKDKRKKFTCSHPWLFLQRMRPVRLGFDYPPGTPDVVRPSVQRAMRQSAGEREAMQLRAAEEVAELVRKMAAAAEAGVQAGSMHHGVASSSAS